MKLSSQFYLLRFFSGCMELLGIKSMLFLLPGLLDGEREDTYVYVLWGVAALSTGRPGL